MGLAEDPAFCPSSTTYACALRFTPRARKRFRFHVRFHFHFYFHFHFRFHFLLFHSYARENVSNLVPQLAQVYRKFQVGCPQKRVN